MYNGILLSHKQDETMPFAATWMQLQIIILSKKSERERQIPYNNHLHMESKMCDTNKLI